MMSVAGGRGAGSRAARGAVCAFDRPPSGYVPGSNLRRRHEGSSVVWAPDPTIKDPTDAIVRVTSTALCGSGLHLYEVLAPFMSPGDILGHEPMGIVEAVGSAVTNIAVGDRVVVPFNIAC